MTVQEMYREIGKQFKSRARNFLGSGWSFYELHDGRAFWIHKTGEVVPSSRNAELLKGKTT